MLFFGNKRRTEANGSLSASKNHHFMIKTCFANSIAGMGIGQVDSTEKAFAPGITKMAIFFTERLQFLLQIVTHLGSIFNQLLFINYREDAAKTYHINQITAPCRIDT